ncbi:MAG: hypothetical protein ACR2LC_00265 [Pyrinomonadaceae bacterium]
MSNNNRKWIARSLNGIQSDGQGQAAAPTINLMRVLSSVPANTSFKPTRLDLSLFNLK